MSEFKKQSEFEIDISETESNILKVKKNKKISFAFGVLSLSFATCAIVLFSVLWVLYNVNMWDSILWHPLLIATLVLIIPAMAVGIVSYIYGKNVSIITKTPLARIVTCGFGLSLILFAYAVGALLILALVYSFM